MIRIPSRLATPFACSVAYAIASTSSSCSPTNDFTQKAEYHHNYRNNNNNNGMSGRKDNKAPPSSTNGPLFDSHCHIGLGFSYNPTKKDPTPENCPHWPFLDEEGKHTCEEQFVRALDNGVTKMALVGIDDVTSTRVKLISEHLNRLALGNVIKGGGNGSQQQHLHAYWTAGIHPHSAHLHKKQFPVIEKIIRDEIKLLREESDAALPLLENKSSSAPPTSGKEGDASVTTGTSHPNTSGRFAYTKLVAIGETGMDFFKSKGSLEDQRESLWRHLSLAYELDVPVIIHARNADDELLQVFNEFIRVKKDEREKVEGKSGEENGKHPTASVSSSSFSTSHPSPWHNGQIRGVMHCFSSDAKWMEEYLKLGFFISFTNNITYNKSLEIQDACARCPTDRIIIETDSPFLPPQRVRGGVNEPVNTRDTFECACRLRGIFGDNDKMDGFQKQLWKNTHFLFNLPL